MDFFIRKAGPGDAKSLRELVQELADAQGTPDGPQISAQHLADDLKSRRVHAFIAYHRTEKDTLIKDKPAGMTLYYYAYSTWQGQFIHMEDLVVSQKYRRRGLAQKLIKEVVKLAINQNMKRVEWSVLENNKSARALYNLIGSSDLTESEGWHLIRLDEDQMVTIVKQSKI